MGSRIVLQLPSFSPLKFFLGNSRPLRILPVIRTSDDYIMNWRQCRLCIFFLFGSLL